MFTKKLSFLIAVFLIGCTTAKSTSGDDMKLIKEQTFSVQSGGKLTLKTPAGNIKIFSWDKNEANVKVYGKDNTEEKMDFEITQSGNDIYVTGKMKSDAGNNNNLSLRYEVTLPKQYNIEANTKGGNVDVSGIYGNMNVNTMGGNVMFDKSEGVIEANTMGGNIHISTSNGKVTANTMGGNIHVSLPSDINGDADITTAAGKISCDFAQPEKTFATSTLKAKFNNGGEAITITTAAGNIHVEKKQ